MCPNGRTYLAADYCFSKLAGADPGGRTRRASPLKLEKNIFWRKIVISHTKYPKHFRAFLRSAQFFKVLPPKREILDPLLARTKNPTNLIKKYTCSRHGIAE